MKLCCEWWGRDIWGAVYAEKHLSGRLMHFHAGGCWPLWRIDTAPRVTDRNAGIVRKPKRRERKPED